MNAKTLASFCSSGHFADAPHPAAFALWLSVHMDAIPVGEAKDTKFVQIGKSTDPLAIQECENPDPMSDRNLSLDVPKKHYHEVLEWLVEHNCSRLTITEDKTYCSVWVDDQVVAWITVKALPHT